MKKIWAMIPVIVILFSCGGGKQVEENVVGDESQMYSGKVKVVETEGMAEVREAGLPEAFDRAREDARRKAIAEALGTIIDATTIARNYQVVEQEIFAREKGYIQKEEVLEKKSHAGGEYVTVKIKAWVKLSKLKDDVMALDILQHRMNMPKTMILIKEETPAGSMNAGYNTMAKEFKEKRFTVISPMSITPAYKKYVKKVYESFGVDDNIVMEAAAKVGNSVNADMVVVGKIKVIQTKPSILKNTSMYSYQATGEFKVINTGDGRIVATTTKQGARAHISVNTGSQLAVQMVAKKAADDLIDQILKAWEDILNNGNLITLYATGLSVNDEILFKLAMKKYFREVREVYNKGRRGNTVIYTVKFLGKPSDLATALVSKSTFPYNVEVLSYDFGKVEIKANKK